MDVAVCIRRSSRRLSQVTSVLHLPCVYIYIGIGLRRCNTEKARKEIKEEKKGATRALGYQFLCVCVHRDLI